jgi:hypothetical protein
MKKVSDISHAAHVRHAFCFVAAMYLMGCGGGGGNSAPPVADTPVKNLPGPTPVTPVSATDQFSIIGYVQDPLKVDPVPSKPATNAGTSAATSRTSPAYYVAPSGSDNAPGTRSAPFRTLARAAKAVVEPGVVVMVAPGTYEGGLRTNVNGSDIKPITYLSTTKWGAKIVPPTVSVNDTAWDNRGDHVTIMGFDIDGSQSRAGKAWSHGIYTGGSFSTIQENHVHHIAQSVTCNSAGGSAIGADSYYHGVQQEIFANTVHDIGLTGCKFIQGVYMSTSGIVANNLIYRVGEAAIHLWHDATNVLITNNTVADSHYGIIVGGGDFYFSTSGNNNTVVANNIVYGNGIGISEQGKTGSGNRYTNNLLYKNGTPVSLLNGLTATDTVSADPLFEGDAVAALTPDFRLSSRSPAIGRGTAVDAPLTDIDGKPRDSVVDIGAYEY